ncbi:hypothetical protein [Streptomyces sp. NPDC006856]|uniref:hypothetical protein n=1 Tax=unclassified Streptomyces TaxID=2593676 RepID=UPI0036C0FCDA
MRSSPGRRDTAIPPTTPTNIVGGTGQPPKELNDAQEAGDLQTMSRESTPTG